MNKRNWAIRRDSRLFQENVIPPTIGGGTYETMDMYRGSNSPTRATQILCIFSLLMNHRHVAFGGIKEVIDIQYGEKYLLFGFLSPVSTMLVHPICLHN